MSVGRAAGSRRAGGRLPSGRCFLLAMTLLVLMIPASAQATTIYVSNAGGDSVSGFTVSPSGSLTQIVCSACATGGSAQGVAMSPNGRFLYAANYDTDTVTPFRIGPAGVLQPIACTGSNCATGSEPFWLGITPDGKFMYAPNYNGTTISAYRIGGNGALTAIACGAGCDTLPGSEEPAITPNGKFLYVPISASDEMLAYAIHGDGTLTPIACGTTCGTGGSYPWTATVTPNGRFLYATDAESDLLAAFAIKSNGSLSRISCAGCATAGEPYSLAVSPNGVHVYAVNYSGTISPYKIRGDGSLTPIGCPSGDCTTGSEPVAVAMSPSGKFLYSANSISDTVSAFSVKAGGLLSPISCSVGCSGLDFPEYGQAIVASPDQAPKASFTHTQSGRRVRFNAKKSKASPGQRVTTYHWNFGDGHRLTTHKAKVSHAYRKHGQHKVTLTVTDNAGCSTAFVFTGQTAYCNGSKKARKSHRVRT